MRRIATTAAAVIAVTLALVGCAPADSETRAPEGPNGYTLSASFDGHELWWDRSTESGMTDLIVEDADGFRVGTCLSAEPIYCLSGENEAKVVLVIGPEGAERAVMHWFGEDVELVRGEASGEGAPPVFGAIMPPIADESAGFQLEVLDGAGAVVFTS
ncbi:hypothetical protein [Agrococcus sp. ARC_14]|uniref:hypothetical protein n=1 Tax=Agrococcus sp. ARC_14 TaxID=2919927 RepID=UPI001F06AD14|nr:hypothetical protein [Agrococcus sp. ARC_14]MCH1882377.1 hypothetical protein [Agrococcus sp. ARC_14]